MPRTYSSARDTILDGAERLIVSHGLSRLSVEAVAQEAGVSKGGFFHHFPTKEAMLLAILERLVESLRQRLEVIAARDPEPRGARLRAQVSQAFDLEPELADRWRALILAFLMAASELPGVIKRARETNTQMVARDVAEDIPEGRALALQFAMDGYWLAKAFGSVALSPRQELALRDTLMALAQPEASSRRRPPAKGSKRKGRRS